MAKKTTRKKDMHLRLAADQLDALRALSTETRVPIGAIVRSAIDQYLDLVERQRPVTRRLLTGDTDGLTLAEVFAREQK